MPLSAPADREALHHRDIALRGYRRADGLFDVEAHLVDAKPGSFFNETSGETRPPGAAVHDMRLRLTIAEDMTVVACEAAMETTPYEICPGAAPAFGRLAGLRIGPGFNRKVAERVGGSAGCTHLRELLGQMATVAYQTLYSLRARAEREEAERRAAAGEPPPRGVPGLVGTCIAYAPDSPVTLARWPWLREEQAAGG